MDKKPLPNRGRNGNLGEIKVVIAAAALTSTLALWNMFSKQMKLEAAASEVTDVPTEVAVTTVDNLPALTMPPIPTLIPPLPDSALVVSAIQPVPSSVTTVTQPVAPSTGKILLGGAQPGVQQQQPRANNRKPATRTRSSS